jgi:hypothetical protein
MPNQDDLDQRNDKSLLTPLLVMAIIIVGGSLVFAFV